MRGLEAALIAIEVAAVAFVADAVAAREDARDIRLHGMSCHWLSDGFRGRGGALMAGRSVSRGNRAGREHADQAGHGDARENRAHRVQSFSVLVAHARALDPRSFTRPSQPSESTLPKFHVGNEITVPRCFFSWSAETDGLSCALIAVERACLLCELQM